jgi:acetylornithine deacetylase/succinyl-diaminopimelate desuccinylase-like protein
MLRTSIAPTIVRGGFRGNVIPSEAEAYLDIRAVPDENMPAFYDELRRVIGDPNVAIDQRSETATRPAAAPSPIRNELYAALEAAQRRVYPGAITIPNMMTGATDMSFVRAKGTPSYGIGPLVEERDRGTGGAHSDDERVAESSLHKFVQFMWEAVVEIAGAG